MNSPCWLEKNNRIKNNKDLSIFEENFTYMYYNFMKFGLVDEVLILPRRQEHIEKEESFKTDSGTLSTIKKERFESLAKDGGNIIYCWLNWEDSKKYSSNNFIIVNPMMNNILHPNKLEEEHHHFALLESPLMRNTLPHFLSNKWEALPLFKYNYDFAHDKPSKDNKPYDIVMVSSLDSRKRVFSFLNLINEHSKKNNKKYKIVFCTWNPDKCSGNDKSENYLKINNLLKDNKNISLDFRFDTNIHETRDAIESSKLFVSTSNFDNGPRAVFEAIQSGIPVLTTQIGASSYVVSGFNGEVISEKNYNQIANYVDYLLEDNQNQSYFERSLLFSNFFTPESFYPSICKRIKTEFDKKYLHKD